MASDDVEQLEIVEMGTASPNALTLIGEGSDLAELPSPVRGWIQRLQAENAQLRTRQEAIERALRAEHQQLELRVASLEGTGGPGPREQPRVRPFPSSNAWVGALTKAMDDAADEKKADEIPEVFSKYPRFVQRSSCLRSLVTWWSTLLTIAFLALYYADLVTDIANFLSFQAAYDFSKTRWDSQWCNADPFRFGTTNRACSFHSDCLSNSQIHTPPPFTGNFTPWGYCEAACKFVGPRVTESCGEICSHVADPVIFGSCHDGDAATGSPVAGSCYRQTCTCRFDGFRSWYCVNKVSQSFEYFSRILFAILLTKEAVKAVGFFVMFFLSVRTREFVYLQFFLNNVFSGLILLIYRGRYLAFLRKHQQGPFAVRIAFIDLVFEDIPQLYFTIALMYYVGDYGSAINLAACIVSSIVTLTQLYALLKQLVHLIRRFCKHASTIQL